MYQCYSALAVTPRRNFKYLKNNKKKKFKGAWHLRACAPGLTVPPWLTRAGRAVRGVWKVSYWTCAACCMTAGRAAARPSPARWRLWKSEWVSEWVTCCAVELNFLMSVEFAQSCQCTHVGCVFSCCQVSPAAVNSSSAASTGSRPPTCSCASAPTRARRPGRRSWPSSRGWASTSPCRRSSPRRPQPWLLSKRGVCGLTCWCTTVMLVTVSRLCSFCQNQWAFKTPLSCELLFKVSYYAKFILLIFHQTVICVSSLVSELSRIKNKRTSFACKK